MWANLLDNAFSGLIRKGGLEVRYPDGRLRRYGPDRMPRMRLVIDEMSSLRRIVLNPDLAFGEAFMDGSVRIEGSDILGLLKLLVQNRAVGQMPAWVNATNSVRYHIRRFLQRNAPRMARRHVAHHYDISDDLYRLFLDSDMQYSCAYFARPGMSLDEAQAAKKAHIAAKLRIEPGMRVLDIGCGWGGLALTLARDFGADVTGITLSDNQLATARARAERLAMTGRVRFDLRDYRHVTGRFDRIVSVGMFEHVGVPNYATYFQKIADLLDPAGIALVHTIGRSGPPQAHSPWIHKYIFPGGYVPSLSEIAAPLEASGLWQADIEVWRLHYAKTLRVWLARFEAAADEVEAMYDGRFVRMFRYYLSACIVAFEDQMQCVYHLQLAHARDAVPLTRDYLYPAAQLAHSRAAE